MAREYLTLTFLTSKTGLYYFKSRTKKANVVLATGLALETIMKNMIATYRECFAVTCALSFLRPYLKNFVSLFELTMKGRGRSLTWPKPLAD